MNVSTYLDLIEAIEAVPMPAEYKRLLGEAMSASAARNGVTAVERRERVNHAIQLFNQGVPRPAICTRLMAMYEIGKTQANAVIGEALTVRKFGGKPNGEGV